MRKIISVMLIFLLLTPMVFAQGPLPPPGAVSKWSAAINNCRLWLTGFAGASSTICFSTLGSAILGTPFPIQLYGLLQFFLLPFLATWMIVYGLMKEMRIFRRARSVNNWLALLIAFSLFPTHIAYPITLFLFQILGAWSVIMFAFIFIAGAWSFGVIRRAQWGSEAAVIETEALVKDSIKKQLKDLMRERRELVEEISYTTDSKKLKALTDRIEKIDKEIANVRKQAATVEEVSS